MTTPAVNIDMENRIVKALSELILADTGIASIVGNRVWRDGDQTHKAVYPCVTIQIIACPPFGFREGWYRPIANLLSETLIHDDKGGAVLQGLAGRLRGFVQSGGVEAQINATASAKATATALTVQEVELTDSFEDKGEQNVRVIGITVSIVCRPSQGANTG